MHSDRVNMHIEQPVWLAPDGKETHAPAPVILDFDQELLAKGGFQILK
jgi:hypothetical protein